MLRREKLWEAFSMMADGAQGDGAVDSGFADFDDDDSIEIVGPGQEVQEEATDEPEKVTLSKEEFEALRNSANSVEAMREGISKLGESMQGQRKAEPVNEAPVQQQGESDDAFWKRFQDELFKSDNPKPLFEEMMNRMAGPYVNQQNAELAKANKRLMMLDPERGDRFRKYLSEIEGFIQTLPREQHTHPQVWEYAYNQVLQRHTDDLISEEVEKRMKEREAERNQSLDSATQDQRQKAPQNFGGAGSGSVSPTKKKRRVQLTAKDYEIMSKEGMSEQDYASWKARNM